MTPKRLTLLIIGLCVATSLPYVVGWLHHGPAQVYMGRIPSNAVDTAAYFSNIEQARQGRLVFANQLTGEPQHPSIIHPLWLVIGWLAWLTHLSTPMAFQVGRLLAVILFVLVMARFIKHAWPDSPHQMLMLVVLTTSVGMGWLFGSNWMAGSDVYHAPSDLWIDESITFRSLAHSAQFIISQLLLLLTVWTWYRRTQNQPLKHDWLTGPGLLLLGFIHPYDLVTAVAITVLWGLSWTIGYRPSPRPLLRAVLWAARQWLWVLPVAVYYVLMPMQEPAVRGWFLQNINISPTPLSVLIGFGLLWPFCWLTIGRLIRRNPLVQFLAIWIAAVVVIMYIPGLTIQRRLMSGMHIPIALLASLSLPWFIDRYILPKYKQSILVCFVAVLAIGNWKSVQLDVTEILQPAMATYPPYITRSERQAAYWLRDHADSNQVIMANLWEGNAITSLAGRPVIMAHGNQTVNVPLKEQLWEELTSVTTGLERRRELIHDLNGSWLVWTSDDATRSRYQPDHDSLLQPRASWPGVAIYSVKTD